MAPDSLPKFSVVNFNDDFCIGRFERSPWVKEGWIAAIIAGHPPFIWGRFRRVDHAENNCEFRFKEINDISKLTSGNSYPYVDGYWGERAELVLDEGRRWTETKFKPTDMVLNRRNTEGTRLLANAPKEGEIVEGGWDHEHCGICWATISSEGESVGYFSEPNTWICSECYKNFVIPRSIGFPGMELEWLFENGA